MPRLALATTAVSSPMGAQVYEEEIASRAPDALGPDWSVSRTIVRSLRSPLPGTVRLPFNHLDRAPGPVRQAAGHVIYPRRALVHRMDLSLPPAAFEVITVHDVVAWKFPDEAPPAPLAPLESRRAAAVVCPSAFSASEAEQFLGVSTPLVVHNGVDQRFFGAEPADTKTLAALGVPSGPFVLHAGGSSLRKNLEGLARAWPIVRSQYPELSLVLSGPQSRRRDELFGGLDGAFRIGRVRDSAVPGLLATASLVVVPSVYEGFGLPAIEAMASGVPVVAANRSSLPEVCGDAALLVEPDGAAIADGIIDVMSGSAASSQMIRRGRVRAREFSWERSAAQHAELWKRLAGS